MGLELMIWCLPCQHDIHCTTRPHESVSSEWGFLPKWKSSSYNPATNQHRWTNYSLWFLQIRWNNIQNMSKTTRDVKEGFKIGINLCFTGLQISISGWFFYAQSDNFVSIECKRCKNRWETKRKTSKYIQIPAFCLTGLQFLITRRFSPFSIAEVDQRQKIDRILHFMSLGVFFMSKIDDWHFRYWKSIDNAENFSYLVDFSDKVASLKNFQRFFLKFDQM